MDEEADPVGSPEHLASMTPEERAEYEREWGEWTEAPEFDPQPF